MKAAATTLFLLLFLASAHGADGALLNISGFSVHPQNFLQGSRAEFNIELQLSGESLSLLQPRVSIYSSGGKYSGSADFFPVLIAGGERQSVSLFWDSSGIPPGSYVAYANVSDGGKEYSAENSIRFSVFSTETLSADEDAANFSDCTKSADCGKWGECEDGYRYRRCTSQQGCSGGIVKAERCAQPENSTICSILPQACGTEGSQSPFCLPAAVAISLLAAYALLQWRKKGRKKLRSLRR